MLKKNLYLIWPTGYYGTYLHWIINKSNVKTSHTTCDLPFLSTGSSHGHYKIPTHMSIESHLHGRIKNNYPIGTIYPIGIVTNVTYNSDSFNWRKTFENVLFWIFRLESEPVIINIFNNCDTYHDKIAAINMYNKEHWEVENTPDSNGYYVYRDNDELVARNYLVENWKKYYPSHYAQVTHNTLEIYKKNYNKTVELRRKYEGHEYDAETYLVTAQGKYFYNLQISDFLKPNFIDIVESMLIHSETGDYDFSYVRSIHDKYLQNQQTFVSLANDLYTQARELYYISSTDTNIFYRALAIDTLKELHGELPNNWESLELKYIIAELANKKGNST